MDNAQIPVARRGQQPEDFAHGYFYAVPATQVDLLYAPGGDDDPVEEIAYQSQPTDGFRACTHQVVERKKISADKPIKAAVDGEVPVDHRVECGQVDDAGIAKDFAWGAEFETAPIEGEETVLLFDKVEEGEIGHDAPEPQ
jgi:hypothetical protein